MTARVDGLAQVGFGVGLELLQDHRGDLRRRVLLAAGLHARVAVGAGDDLVGDDRLLLAHLGLLAAHEALDREDVFCGLVTAWRLATVPTRRSPEAVKATTDGVVRPPSAFSMTVGSPPSSTAMHEFVVPRSMPMVFAHDECSSRDDV